MCVLQLRFRMAGNYNVMTRSPSMRVSFWMRVMVGYAFTRVAWRRSAAYWALPLKWMAGWSMWWKVPILLIL